MCGIIFHNCLVVCAVLAVTIALVVWVEVYVAGDKQGLEKLFSKMTPPDYFLWHPVLMFFSYGVMMSAGMGAYRLLPGSHEVRKIFHMLFHLVAVIIGFVGLYPVYKFHALNKIPDNYSAHSYFGLMTVTVAAIQWILGFVYYFLKLPGLVPTESLRRRREFAPLHRFLGMATYITAMCTIIMGIFDKQHIVNLDKNTKTKYSALSIYANILSLSVAWLTAIVLYYYTTPYRKPQPMFDENATYTEDFLAEPLTGNEYETENKRDV